MGSSSDSPSLWESGYVRQVICSDTISITGKAQQTYAAMSAEEAMDYWKVNTVIHYNMCD